MQVVLDIEANALNNPTQVWCIVCKDIDTGQRYIFREVTTNAEEKEKFLAFSRGVSLWIGHNVLGYDLPVLADLCDLDVSNIAERSCDTLVISKLVGYSRGGHSVEDYGLEFGLEKISVPFSIFHQFSEALVDYCIRDVEITHKIFSKYEKVFRSKKWKESILLEQEFQLLVNDLHDNGFYFNRPKAEKLLAWVTAQLSVVDKELADAFPPKLKEIREITPKVTKFGTLSRSDFRWVEDHDLSEFNGGPFCRCRWEQFNPSSHKQLISVLNEAGWHPIDKTTTHIETERAINKVKHGKGNTSPVDLEILSSKLDTLKVSGWKINENNLDTLPSSAPSPARSLAHRILLESRRRTLTEWLGLADRDTSRIHGKFYGIGAWTHRMAHQQPNTANIPSATKLDGSTKLLGREMRELWCAPRNRLLVGVDAEGIQLRIFAHYIDDEEFTLSLVKGKKSDKSDPHSLNQRILGDVCRSRAAAKRFIFALLLGAGLGKLAEILECSEDEAKEALDRLLRRYEGFAYLKQKVIPGDARKGYFIGLDGREVPIPGEEISYRKHLCMSGYLQNGEAVVMKKAAVLWNKQLRADGDFKRWLFVNMVHDEWQTEVANDMSLAVHIASTQAEALEIVGQQLHLKCPLAGSYWNDDHGDYTIGTNWYTTH